MDSAIRAQDVVKSQKPRASPRRLRGVTQTIQHMPQVAGQTPGNCQRRHDLAQLVLRLSEGVRSKKANSATCPCTEESPCARAFNPRGPKPQTLVYLQQNPQALSQNRSPNRSTILSGELLTVAKNSSLPTIQWPTQAALFQKANGTHFMRPITSDRMSLTKPTCCPLPTAQAVGAVMVSPGLGFMVSWETTQFRNCARKLACARTERKQRVTAWSIIVGVFSVAVGMFLLWADPVLV